MADPLAIYNGIDKLIPRMQFIVGGIEDIIKFHNLPIRRFETWRSNERQLDCFNRGASKVKTGGSHNEGRAVDYVYYGSLAGMGPDGIITIDQNENVGWSWDKKADPVYNCLAFFVQQKFPSVVCGAFWTSFYDPAHYEISVLA